MRKMFIALLCMAVMLFASCSGEGNPPLDEEFIAQIDPEGLLETAIQAPSGVHVTYSLEPVSAGAVAKSTSEDCILKAIVTFDSYPFNGVSIESGVLVYEIPGTVADGKFTANGGCTVNTETKLSVKMENGSADFEISARSSSVTLSAAVSGSSVSQVDVSISITDEPVVDVSNAVVEEPGEDSLADYVDYINSNDGNVDEPAAAGNLLSIVFGLAQSVLYERYGNLGEVDLNVPYEFNGESFAGVPFDARFWGTVTPAGDNATHMVSGMSADGRLEIDGFGFEISGRFEIASLTGQATVNGVEYHFLLTDIM